ncbi:GTP cyclohydrolase II [Streptomyces sp. NPDC005573]|uniref:GTP cyclohydrolase II n=1 Tax=Streptomyces sp. NPDC005573 TaxID=3156890 RepID=UPI0033AD7E05
MTSTTASTPIASATVRAQVPIGIERGTDSRTGPVQATLTSFSGLVDGREHVAVAVEAPHAVPLVRVHSECLTGDVFGSRRCDCGPQLDEAMETVARDGGIILYLRQEGRGIGLYNKIDAYALQDTEVDTFSANQMLGRGADEREYTVAAQMLLTLGVQRIRLLTNNPEKVRQLREYGIDVIEILPTRTHVNPDNMRYLRDKSAMAGHTLDVA